MKKSLLQRRAFYAALFVLLLVVVDSKNAFAQTQVATLQHGEEMSAFYGVNAFVEAHEAAQPGDIITLSSGTFTSCGEITKAITLRGAGCAYDTISQTSPTFISGDLTLTSTSSSDSLQLSLEGIHFLAVVYYQTLHSPRFIKCNFYYFKYHNSNNYYNHIYDAYFVNCKIREIALHHSNTSLGHNITFINCVIRRNAILAHSTCIAYNSIIRCINTTIGFYDADELSAFNCIFINDSGTSTSTLLRNNSTAYNCIGISSVGIVFGSDILTYNCTMKTFAEVFETFDGTSFDFDEQYVLTEEIATGFLGNDGTEVGIYGGFMPYNPRPTYMVMKRCNVAGKSTIDGKLSVDIEVVTEQ